MIFSLYVIVLFSFYSSALCGSPHVLKLNDDNFERQLALHDNIIVMYFIPWSLPCRNLGPHFSKAAEVLNTNKIPVTLAKMDCSEAGRRICRKKNIQHRFPIIKLYKNKQIVKEYQGSRCSRAIVNFARVQVSPAVVELKNVEEFRKFLASWEDVVFVGFFDEPNSKLKRRFFRIAEEMKEAMIFAYTSCEKLLMREGVLEGIVLFRPPLIQNIYEEDRVLFRGTISIGEVRNFVINNYNGLVGLRSPVNIRHFQNPQIIVFYTVDYHNDGRELMYWRNRVLKIAHKYKDSVRFSLSAKDEFEEELAHFPVDFSSVMEPFVLGVDLENKKYYMKEKFSSSALDTFVGDFIDRKLEPFHHSKAICSENEGLVIIATDDSFNETVLENDKDTFIDLYTPSIGHCKQFAPLLSKVADLLHQEDVAIMKMDISQNKVLDMFLEKEIPNVFWLSKYKKTEPVVYHDPVSVDAVVKFIARSATNKLKTYGRDGLLLRRKEEL